MSLNWNAENSANWDKLSGYAQETLIFATIPLGINKITNENYQEFYARYLKLMLIKGWNPDISPEDVKNAIGLYTNASSKTPAKFGKDLLEALNDTVAYRVKRAYAEETL